MINIVEPAPMSGAALDVAKLAAGVAAGVLLSAIVKKKMTVIVRA